MVCAWAATELSFDAGGRFIKQGPLVLPSLRLDNSPSSRTSSGVSALKSLLDPDNAEDPLVEKLRGLESKGRSGAIVTEVRMAPGFGEATVEATLYVKAEQKRWIPAGKRSVTVRAGDIPKDNAERLAEDPMVKQSLAMVEALGLGKIDPQQKQLALFSRRHDADSAWQGPRTGCWRPRKAGSSRNIGRLIREGRPRLARLPGRFSLHSTVYIVS